MTIARILGSRSTAVTSVTPDTPVREVVALLAKRRIGAVPVIADGMVAGILSERDIVYGLAREGASLLDRAAGAVMTSPVITAEPAMPLLHALGLMTRRRIRHLPVMENGAMVGFVSIGDLVKARIEAIETEADAMRSYIQAT